MPYTPLVFRLLKFLHNYKSKDKTPLLYSYLTCVANYTDEKKGTPCWASVKTLAIDIGCSARSVHRIQKKAVKLGLLEVKNRYKNNIKLTNYLILRIPDLKLNTEAIDTENLSPELRQKGAEGTDIMAYNKLNDKLNDKGFNSFKGSKYEERKGTRIIGFVKDLKSGKQSPYWPASWGPKPTAPDFEHKEILKALEFDPEDYL